MSRYFLLALTVACATAPAAVAQDAPPVGSWSGAGDYCLNDWRIVAPDGYEARADEYSPNALYLRKADADAHALPPGQVGVVRFLGDMSAFRNFSLVERVHAPCNDGAPYERLEDWSAGLGFQAIGVLVLRCESDAGAYGEIFMQAAPEEGDRSLHVMVSFGVDAFRREGRLYGENGLPSEEEAVALLDALAAGFRACER